MSHYSQFRCLSQKRFVTLRQLFPRVGLWATREAERRHRKEQVLARRRGGGGALSPERRERQGRARLRRQRLGARRTRLRRESVWSAGPSVSAAVTRNGRSGSHGDVGQAACRPSLSGRCSHSPRLTGAVPGSTCQRSLAALAVSQRVNRAGATRAAPGETRPRRKGPKAACREAAASGGWGPRPPG